MPLITTTVAKSYLGVEHTDDDTLIGELVGYVVGAAEKFTGRTFTQDGETGRTEYHDGGVKHLIVKKPPIASIEGIYDSFNDDDEVDSDSYNFDPDAGLIYISQDATLNLVEMAALGEWGAGRRRWKVTYVGGNDGLPDDVKLACLMWIADLYQARAPNSSERLGDWSFNRDAGMPEKVKAILASYSLPGL